MSIQNEKLRDESLQCVVTEVPKLLATLYKGFIEQGIPWEMARDLTMASFHKLFPDARS